MKNRIKWWFRKFLGIEIEEEKRIQIMKIEFLGSAIENTTITTISHEECLEKLVNYLHLYLDFNDRIRMAEIKSKELKHIKKIKKTLLNEED